MQCPQCGMNMGDAKECPHCGARVAAHPLASRYMKPEPRHGLSPFATIIIILVLAGLIAVLFVNSDLFKSIQARRFYERGEYAATVEIVYGLMEKSGPNEIRLALASDALRAQGEERMDEGDYVYALPLFDEIIKINERAIGSGGDSGNILYAKYDIAICNLRLAQEEGKYVKPYGEYILAAKKAIEEAMDIAGTIGTDDAGGIEADLNMLAAQAALDRAVASLHAKDTSQARVFLQEAENYYQSAIAMGIDPEKFELLREELDKLGRDLQ